MTVHTRMSQHRDPAGGRDEVHRLVDRHLPGARHMRRATRTHDRVQVFAGDTRLGGLDGGDDVRLADVAPGVRPHRVPINFVPDPRQAPDGFALLGLAGLAGFLEPASQPPIVEGKAIAEQVGVDEAAVGFVLDRELDARDHPQTVPLESAEVVDARQRVVVGEGDDLEAGGGMGADDLRRRELSIAEDRVQVQVRPPV